MTIYNDLRIEWIRQCVCDWFDLPDATSFNELLSRGDGEEEEKILCYLNTASEEDSASFLLFCESIREQEIEVEIPVERERSTDPSNHEETQRGAEIELHVAVNQVPEPFRKSRVLCFQRNTKEAIVEPLDLKEANNLMPRLFEIDLLIDHSILSLQQKLAHVYTPLITVYRVEGTAADYQSVFFSPQEEPSGEGGNQPVVMSSRQLPTYDELLNSIPKVLEVVNSTLSQLQTQGEVALHIPELDLEPTVDELMTNPDIVDRLEQCVMNWQAQVASVIEEQKNKKPQAPGPMAEILIWQERASVLNTLRQQLELPVVQKILEVMIKAEKNAVQTLEGTRAEFLKYCVESADNVRVLNILERHFKNLVTGTNFRVLLETIPPLMDSLRIVWIISCHYNTNENMVPLMERIVWQLSESVASAIDVHVLFKNNKKVAKAKVKDAKKVLEKWQSSYFEVRAEIEQAGINTCWEFDHKRLFERTNYIASICQDLHNVLLTLEEIHSIFGPELKRVTADPKHIDEALCRVDLLVSPFEEITFDPFNISNMSSWKTTMQDFHKAVQTIEKEAFSLIDLSFKTMCSSATAFDMLLKFKHFCSREAISKHLMTKSNDILAQYCKEVDKINEIFEGKKDKPPVNKNETPVAGAIRWVRSLFLHIEHGILHFKKFPGMMDSDQGKEADRKFMEMLVKIKTYDIEKYESWLVETEHNLPLLMKKPLLAQADLVVSETEGRLPKGVKYILNSVSEIKEIILETKDLMSMDYTVPELARSMALQEDKVIDYVYGLKKLVNSYNSSMDSLSETKLIMLEQQIKTVNQVLLLGCKRLNWNSIGISDFITRGTQAVSKFESAVNQILKIERDIDSNLQCVVKANILICPSFNKHSLPGIRKFCEHIERERVKTLNLLRRKYADIGALLIKMEHLIMATSSGKSRCMADYYRCWEHKVLDSLKKMVLRNIQAFNTVLMGRTVLFQIEGILSAPKIVMQPSSNEIYRLIMQCIRNSIESTKEFVRWMHGACIECPPQCVDGEEELVIFSFYSDVCQDPQINENTMAVSQNIQQLLFSLDQYLNHWKCYWPLWEENDATADQEFAARKPSCVMFDEKLQFIVHANQQVMLEPLFKNEHIIHLNLEPLAHTLRQLAETWINSLGRLLHKSAKEELFSLRDELMQLSELTKSPHTFEELKNILGNTQNMSLNVEMRLTDIQERYRALAIYNMEVAEEEQELVGNISQMWSDLFSESRRVNCSQSDVEKSLTDTTNRG